MAEFIDIRLKRAALALATTLDYARAAESLKVSDSELRGQVKALEDHLCVHLFEPDSDPPVLTDEGHFLIQGMRQLLARVGQGEV